MIPIAKKWDVVSCSDSEPCQSNSRRRSNPIEKYSAWYSVYAACIPWYVIIHDETSSPEETSRMGEQNECIFVELDIQTTFFARTAILPKM